MKLRAFLILAVVTTVLAGFSKADPFSRGGISDRLVERISEDVDPNMTPMREPGDYRFSFIRDGVGRDYFVHVPDQYHGQPMPMLIALHEEEGEGGFAEDTLLIRKSQKAGFVIVAPNGYPLLPSTYSRFPSGSRATWNAGRCCGPAKYHNADDVGFIREVINRVERQANIDHKRIFVTGFSNGAMMAWRLACEAPEVRGIAPVAGTDNTETCHPSHPVAVIEFHASDDDHLPFYGGKGDPSIGHIDFTSVDASQQKWVEIDRANPAPERVLSVRGAYCDLHRGQAGGAPVELCVTERGRHSWPGPTQAINAYNLMWDFFSSL